MLGAIAGDIIGSVYEFNSIKTKNFELFGERSRFTDDTVMTAAVAEACEKYLLHKDTEAFKSDVILQMKKLGSSHVNSGYGESFLRWLTSVDSQPYNSWGNGSAMRVSAAAYVSETIEEAIALAKASAEVTHNHPEGIKGAKAAAVCIFMALHGSSKEEIKKFVEDNFYSLDFTVDGIRHDYGFDVSCQGSVPQSIQCFLEGKDYEDTVRNAVSLGGDSDTMACIAGGIAEAYFGIPQRIKEKALSYLDREILGVLKNLSYYKI